MDFATIIVLLSASFSEGLRLNRDPTANGIQRPAVFTFACGYEKKQVAPFVASLRYTGYSGDIVMAVSSTINADTTSFLNRHKVTMRTEPCDEQAAAVANGEHFKDNPHKHSKDADDAEEHLKKKASKESLEESLNPAGGHLMQRRHYWFDKWLKDSEYDAIWIIDSRDAFFQADPFVNLTFNENGLSLYVDYPGNSKLVKYARGKVEQCYADGKELVENMEAVKFPDICGGGIAGTRSAMMKLSKDWMAMIEKKDGADWKDWPCAASDQYVLTTVAFKEGHAYNEPWEGSCLNANNIRNVKKMWKRIKGLTDENGELVKILNSAGNPFPVIHKFDYAGVTQGLLERQMKLWDIA